MLDHGLHDVEVGAPAQHEAGQALDAGCRDGAIEPPQLVQGHGHGLLHQDVLAGLRGGDALLGMAGVEAADIDHVEVLLPQHLLVVGVDAAVLEAVLRSSGSRVLFTAATQRDHVAVAGLQPRVDVGMGDPSDADHADADSFVCHGILR